MQLGRLRETGLRSLVGLTVFKQEKLRAPSAISQLQFNDLGWLTATALSQGRSNAYPAPGAREFP